MRHNSLFVILLVVSGLTRASAQDQSGNIFIYRPAHFVGSDYNPPILCHGIQLGTIVSGTYLEIEAPAGPHNCVAESVQLPVTALTVISGEALYLRVNIQSGFKKHAFLYLAPQTYYKGETKLRPLASSVRLSGPQQLERSSPISASGMENSRKLGDLEIAVTKVETKGSSSAENPVASVFIAAINTGSNTICASFAAHLETSSAESLDSIASSSPLDVHELSSGGIARGTYDFSLVNGQKPILLWLQLQNRSLGCGTSAHALVHGRYTASAIMMDLHDLPGEGVIDSHEAKTAKPGVDGVSYPKCIQCPNPKYTPDARKARFQGTIDLQVVINSDGKPGNIELIHSSGYVDLDRQALETVRTWRFQPSVGPDGAPVPVGATVNVTFRLT
ncbi:MAG TPA: TonB family protein [Candidatus Acidoferrales bacterium]|jgi:TonB family protein